MSRAVLYCGDALTVLRTLPGESVQCCVTSPPYWGLRDYGTALWQGGDETCSHAPRFAPRKERPAGGLTGGKDTVDAGTFLRGDCVCGARRVDSQLGLERTPEEYVANMVSVFREVKRVLRNDGTLWLNVGDSYAAGGKGGGGSYMAERRDAAWQQRSSLNGWRAAPEGLKAKDLVGIPWRFAFALQADGWFLRSDIIWAKPNPMPESVTDRPTKAHEYVFLLSRSRQYYYDAAAIAEESVDPIASASLYRYAFTGRPGLVMPDGKKQQIAPEGMRSFHLTRNARTVWEISTQPYPEAHFATFPEELARRCILAGSRPGDTVLDPFGGSGTVAQVATGNGRNAVYIDLNPKYRELALQRVGPMLCDVA